MAIKTPVLYNAAYNGYLAGAIAGGIQSDSTAADYSKLTAQAVNFATEVDTVVGAIAAVETGNASFVPASAANTNNLVSYTAIMFGICFGQAFGRFRAPAVADTAASFAAAAAVVNAIFTEAIASQSNA